MARQRVAPAAAAAGWRGRGKAAAQRRVGAAEGAVVACRGPPKRSKFVFNRRV